MTPIWVSENGNSFPINRLRRSERAKIGAHCFEEGPFRGGNVLGNRISESQRINYCEAALIRYFQPTYNTEFKNSFPSPSHSSYEECYKLDLNSVTVELDCTDAGVRIWTPTIPAAWVHLPSFVLHSEAERRSMFDFFPDKKAE